MAGTSTLAEIYTSFAGTSAVNSVSSNSTDASFEFWISLFTYDSSQKYKLVLSKSGYTSQTIDNVNIDSVVLATYVISSDTTITTDLGYIPKGVIFSVASGKTLTINGTFDAGKYQIFSGSGTVTIGSNAVDQIRSQWFGNTNDFLTFTASDTTPSVKQGSLFKTANAVATTITTFDDGYEGKEIIVFIDDANTTFDFTGTTLKGNRGVDYTASQYDWIHATYDGTNWLCSPSSQTSTSPAALTKTDDTNVTLTLGGTPTTALLNATSLTLGWTGQLAVSRGGTGLATLTQGYIPFGQGTSAFGSDAGLFWDNTNKRLGIGTITPDAPLSFAASTGDKIQLYDNAGAATYGMGIQSNNFQFLLPGSSQYFTFNTGLSAAATEIMRIQGNGYVDIVGGVRADSFQFGDSTTVKPILLQDTTGVNGRRLSIEAVSATASCEIQLLPGADIDGSTNLTSEIIWFNKIGANYERFTIATVNNQYVIDSTVQGTGTIRNIYFVMGTSNAITILSDTKVGIGNVTPAYQFQVATDSAGKPGVGGLWTVVSDERIKKDIELADLDRCYEIVKSVPLKRFEWADGVYTEEQVRDRHNLGWISQDVQKVFPKATNTISFTKLDKTIIEDCLGLNSGQLYAAMYGAVQKMIQKVEILEKGRIYEN